MNRLLALVPLLSLSACPPTLTPDGGEVFDGGAGVDGGVTFVNPLPDGRFDGAAGYAIAAHGGKVYVAGGALRGDAGTDSDFFISRFNADGTRDGTFGDDGVALAVFDGGVLVTLPARIDAALALGFDGDKPVAVGAVRGPVLGGGDLGLARFTADGQLDPTFDTGGLRADSFGRPAMLTQAAGLADGRLLVAGTVENGLRNRDFVALRYTAAGAPDPTFSIGSSGAGAVIDCGSNGSETATGLVLQGEKLVLGGGSHFCVTRVDSNGQLDTSFGTGGFATRSGGTGDRLVQRADGTLWMVGRIERNRDGGSGTEAVWLKQTLLTADGAPVPGFGTDGERRDLLPTFGPIRGAALQADGKLLVYFHQLLRGHLLRLNVDGSLDTSFGTDGLMPLEVRLPLFVTDASNNHLIIVGNTAWVTDLHLVDVSPSQLRQFMQLLRVEL